MFCSRCGRKLEEGEVCPCMKDTAKNPGQPQARPHIQLQKPQPGGAQGQSGPQGNPYPGQPGPGPRNPYQGQPGSQGNPYQGNAYQGNPYQGNPYQNQQWQPSNASQDQIVTEIKKFFQDALSVLKRPVSETQRLTGENSMITGLRFIIAKAVIALIIALIAVAKIDDLMGGYVDLPYGTVILLTLIGTIGSDCLEALLMKVFSGVFGGMATMEGMFTVVGSRAIFDTLVSLISSIFLLLSPILGIILSVMGGLVIPYVQFGGYRAVSQGNEDKKVYAFFVAKVCVAAVVAILTYLISLNTILSSLADIMRYL